MQREEEQKISVLMNIDSYYGEHTGRVGPLIKFLGVAVVPMFVYIFFFVGIIPLKWVLIFEVLFVLRMALLILGKENEKMQVYLAAQEDEYANADDIIRVSRIQEDGLIEYEDGSVAYIISAFTTTYFDESELVRDLEKFAKMLGKYNYDIHMHMVYNEFLLQDNMERMRVYEDLEVLKERIDMYVYQDEEMAKNTLLYRINFVVKGARYAWKELRADVREAVNSEYSRVFKECYVCGQQEANDVMSRDLLVYIDLEEMIKKKYGNDDYDNSKVYFYGEQVPEQYQQKEESVGMKERRVWEKEEE